MSPPPHRYRSDGVGRRDGAWPMTVGAERAWCDAEFKNCRSAICSRWLVETQCMPYSSSKIRFSIPRFANPTGISGSGRRDHRRDRRDPPDQLLLRPDPSPRRGQATPVRNRVDPRPDRAERQGQPIRWRVALGGKAEYGVTQNTRKLFEHWTDPDRERRLFFCQIEALETLIYITEAARKIGDVWIEKYLREANERRTRDSTASR